MSFVFSSAFAYCVFVCGMIIEIKSAVIKSLFKNVFIFFSIRILYYDVVVKMYFAPCIILFSSVFKFFIIVEVHRHCVFSLWKN